MKKLLTILFSFFLLGSPSVFASDISDLSDLSIEGISIGDSLLDYMTEDEILEGVEMTKGWHTHLKEPNKYAEVNVLQNSREYDWVSVYIKNNNFNEYVSNKNEKYKILAIRGVIYYPQDFNNCIKERDKIVEIFSKILSSAEKSEYSGYHSADPSRDSIIDTVHLNKSHESSRYSCIDWGESISSKNNWIDNLSISLRTKEIISWFSDY